MKKLLSILLASAALSMPAVAQISETNTTALSNIKLNLNVPDLDYRTLTLDLTGNWSNTANGNWLVHGSAESIIGGRLIVTGSALLISTGFAFNVSMSGPSARPSYLACSLNLTTNIGSCKFVNLAGIEQTGSINLK